MHGNLPNMFDCWADPLVHLLLLNSFMVRHNSLIMHTQILSMALVTATFLNVF